MDSKDYPPSAKLLTDGYNQTYIICARDGESENIEGNEVLFRCGNWCYKGLVQFNGIKFNTEEIPIIIPTLQRQQGSLRYYCTAKSVPEDSEYYLPMKYMEDALDFLGAELTSESLDKELRKMANIFPWIDDDASSTYFELSIGILPDYMKKIDIIASKTYTRGLIIISIYFDKCIYCVIQGGEGDQPLLDVRFPNVSKHGQGLLINTYNDDVIGWKKLTLWHILEGDIVLKKEIPKIKTINVSTANYEQTYCILKSSTDPKSPLLSVYHDALFRFGSWCYSGRVQLTPTLTLQDVPYVIPALRMQQSRLDFFCDVNNFPVNSPYAAALEYVKKVNPLVEAHIGRSEETLKSLIDRLSNMGLGESVSKWLEGDSSNSFFEFKLSPSEDLSRSMKNVEMIVSKCYHASGIITIMIIFEFTVYVSVLENQGENPLLDSRFPDVSGKGRGYQIEAFSNGTPEWEELRKVSVWQTVSALEQEFREKAAQYAQAKGSAAEDQTEKSEGLAYSDGDDEKNEDQVVEDVLHDSNAKSVANPVEVDSKVGAIEESDAKSIPLAEAKSQQEKPQSTLSPMKIKQALPHHLPKLDALSNKLDSIRTNIGDSGLKAPWDSKGKPLGSISNNLKK